MEKMTEKNAIEKIFDENNTENVFLRDESNNNKTREFEQIANIPFDGKIYVILREVGNPNLADNEVGVFVLEVIDGEDCLIGVDDEKIVSGVFKEYFKLLEE